MKRILYVITNLEFAGAQNQLYHIIRKLKENGWEIAVVSLKPLEGFAESLSCLGVEVLSLGMRNKLPNPVPVIKLVKIIKRWNPTIVHGFLVHANLITRFVRPFVRIPILISSARNINEGGKFRELLYKLTDRLCDLTTQVSQQAKEYYMKRGIVSKDKIIYIPNGVDTEIFKPSREIREKLRQEMNLEGFVWITVGRLEEQKDYPTLLQAFSCLINEHRLKSTLLICGKGPLYQRLILLAKELNIDNFVRFLGVRTDIPFLLNAADAFVLSSKWEGMSNAVLEAAASGLPIVATNVSGNDEIVLNHNTGILVSPGEPKLLAEAMLKLQLLSDEKRMEMGLLARQHVLKNFSLEHVCEMWETLYFELLRKKGLIS